MSTLYCEFFLAYPLTITRECFMTPDDAGLVDGFNLHWKDQRMPAMKTRIGVIEKDLKAFHEKVLEIFQLVPYHLNELKELKALVEDRADDKDERKKITVLADTQREHDRCVRHALQEQRLHLRSLKRRIVPAFVPPTAAPKPAFVLPPVPAPPAPKKAPAHPFVPPAAPAPKKADAKKAPVKKAKKMKTPLAPGVEDVVMEEAKFARGAAAAPEEEDIGGEAKEAEDIAAQEAESEADEEDEGDEFIAPSDESDEEEKADPAMYEPPHPPLSRDNLMLYYGLSQKKRNELWDLRRDAAREDDPDTRRDLYDEADAALYEAIRLLKVKADAAAARKADLARRAQEQSGRSVVLEDDGLDEKHQDPTDLAEPSPAPSHPSMASRFMSGVAGLNPFQRG